MNAATTNACVGEIATRMSSLSLDDDAERAIVQGIDTIRDADMPFVNRHEELWQMFRVNADNMRQIKLSQNPIENFRPLHLLFCVHLRTFVMYFLFYLTLLIVARVYTSIQFAVLWSW